MPEHLARIRGEQWALWRCVGVRSAGFPASGIFKLAAPACAAAADEVVRAEQNAERAWLQAIEAFEDEIAESEGQRRAELIKALLSLKNGDAPKGVSAGHSASQLTEAFEGACGQVDSAWDEYNSVFKESVSRVSTSMEEIARSGRFREAIAWQNRRALHGSLDALLRMSPAEGSRRAERRKREEAVANYWQRYSMKNDTIGFFGPVGWAKIVREGEPISVRPGDSMLAERKLYFEAWCVDALAETLAQDEAMLPWIAPRRMPFIWVDDRNLYAPQEIRTSPTAENLSILRLCDGWRTAKEIAQELITQPALALDGEEAVYRLLARLRDDGLISWTLQVPLGPRPEASLRGRLERIGEDGLRGRSLEALGELERARDAAEAAAGDAARVDEAMA
ncbi:MAG TPA: lantibiotic dehydratase, partial [Blastocatellia bacterium]|nr:lantibiotic dehydratase [Blastocatellia bacterium]